MAVFTPMSAVKRISSISASVDSSTWREPPKIPWSRAMNPPRVFSRPAASVRPASASARRRFSSSIRRRASSASRASRAASSRATRSASSRSSRRRSLSSRSASFFCRYSSFLRVSSATATASRRATSAGVGAAGRAHQRRRGRESRLGDGLDAGLPLELPLDLRLRDGRLDGSRSPLPEHAQAGNDEERHERGDDGGPDEVGGGEGERDGEQVDPAQEGESAEKARPYRSRSGVVSTRGWGVVRIRDGGPNP